MTFNPETFRELAGIDIEKLRKLDAAATPGPWETDSEYDGDAIASGGGGCTTGFLNYFVGADIDGKWKTLLDTVNSDHKLVEEDYDEDGRRSWDEIGRANAELAAYLRTITPAILALCPTPRPDDSEVGKRKGVLMGYNLSIGEAVFKGSREDAYLRVTAEHKALDDAPVFANDVATGNGNCRSPGYSVWTDFCRDTGLYGMFYGLNGRRNPYMEPDPDCHREAPILAEHPGFALINESDVSAIKQALDRHIAAHGELEPGFRPWGEREGDAPANAKACAIRARLIWLHFWCDWAVKNCTWPIIANS